MLKPSLLILALLFVFGTSSFSQRKATPPAISAPDAVYCRTCGEYPTLLGLSCLAAESFNAKEFEIRVWVVFANTFPGARGIVLAKRKGILMASYVTGNLGADRKPEIVKDLNFNDSSGMKNFGEDFDIKRLIAGKHKAGAGWGDPDATDIIVEVRRGNSYKLIQYQANTASTEGKKILEYVSESPKIVRYQINRL
ncbi:MAG: hypothetical protein WKF92_15805 [Pyrinomonadaceae bacterium]